MAVSFRGIFGTNKLKWFSSSVVEPSGMCCFSLGIYNKSYKSVYKAWGCIFLQWWIWLCWSLCDLPSLFPFFLPSLFPSLFPFFTLLKSAKMHIYPGSPLHSVYSYKIQSFGVFFISLWHPFLSTRFSYFHEKTYYNWSQDFCNRSRPFAVMTWWYDNDQTITKICLVTVSWTWRLHGEICGKIYF